MKTLNDHDTMLEVAQPNSTTLEVGKLFVTPGVQESISCVDLATAIRRHFAQDWGEVCEHDWQANDEALQRGGRLVSTYDSKEEVRFWIITEACRSMTTILLPNEY